MVPDRETGRDLRKMSKTNGRTNCRSDRSVWQEYRGEPSGCVSRLMLWRYPNRTALGAGCPASSGSIEKSRLPDLPYRKMACDRKSIAERYGY